MVSRYQKSSSYGSSTEASNRSSSLAGVAVSYQRPRRQDSALLHRQYPRASRPGRSPRLRAGWPLLRRCRRRVQCAREQRPGIGGLRRRARREYTSPPLPRRRSVLPLLSSTLLGGSASANPSSIEFLEAHSPSRLGVRPILSSRRPRHPECPHLPGVIAVIHDT